jgi:hypothetical protein
LLLAQYESNAKHWDARSKRAAGLNDVALQNGWSRIHTVFCTPTTNSQQHSDTATLCRIFTSNLLTNTVNYSDYRKHATMAVRAQFENSNE